MIKKLVALTLCLVMSVAVFAGCADDNKEYYDGAYVTMYIADEMYDFDPANAYANESALKIVSLLYDNLFVLDAKGKVQKSLAKKYEIIEDEELDSYKMLITLKDTKWTDGTPVSANDVVYAWTRLLKPENSYAAASLLFDIKNARAAKDGDVSIDDVQIIAIENDTVEITFEGPIDYDQFLLNLTSYALVPLREDIVRKTDDWSKQPSTTCTSGPFRIRKVSYEKGEETLILERNSYYYRNNLKDAADKYVTPYRLIIDYSMSDEEILEAYNAGELFYIGDVPLSLRGESLEAEVADIMDSMSTHTYFINENARVRYYDKSDFKDLKSEDYAKVSKSLKSEHGKKIFSITEVREALSLAIDRADIASKVVFAEAASGLIPYGVFNSDSARKSFREEGGSLISSSANMDEAKELLASVDVDPDDYMFTIAVAAYDDVHMLIAEEVQKAWEELGFHVAINAVKTITNNDKNDATGETSKIIRDDVFAENYRAGTYEVAAIDYVAYSADAFSMLAPFAVGFSGNASAKSNSPSFSIPTHHTRYNSEDYNALIEDAFAQKDIDDRATILHEAEELLLEDKAVLTIIFNQNAKLVSSELSKIKTSYYGNDIFTKMVQKDFKTYLPEEVVAEIEAAIARDAEIKAAQEAKEAEKKKKK